MRELKLALRRFRRRPVHALATALTLAIGVGATTAAFAAVDGVLLRALPVQDQDELVVAWRVSERTPIRLPYSGVWFDVLRQDAGSLSALAGYSAWGALPILVEADGEAYSLNGAYVTGGFFRVLGARPALGRLLDAEDDAIGATPAVVLSHSAWRTRYGADPDVVGSTLVVSDEAVTVVGVAPAGLEYPRGTDLWYPLRADYASPPDGPAPELHLVGRMAEGVDAGIVAADLATALRASDRVPETPFEARQHVVGFEEEVVGSVRPILRAALAAALVLLLAATANATLFLLAGGRRARTEVAVRSALGAERGQLLGRVLSDAGIVGALAGASGLLIVWLALGLLTPLAPTELPRFETVAVDGRVVALAFALAVGLTLTTGAAAAFVLSRLDEGRLLLSAGRERVGGDSGFRRAIAGLQVALTVVSGVGAGLLLRTVAAMDSVDPGFAVEDVTAVSLRVPYTWFDVPDEYLLALEDVSRELESRPGIAAARPTLGPPLQQRLEVTLRAEGQSDEAFASNPSVSVDAVLPGHFEAMGIPIRAGRGVTATDNRPDAAPIVVVDEVLARTLWPGEDPIGRRIIGLPRSPETAVTVVGVAAATRYRELLEVHPRAYFPLRLVGDWPPSAFLVRTADDVAVPVRELAAEAFASIHPRVRVLSTQNMTDALREPTVSRRFAATVLAGFAGATLLLAGLGVYGVFTVSVQERRREMGVRIALGAQRTSIVRSVLWRIAKVATAGAIAGLAVAWWGSRLIAALLYGVSASDATTFAVVMAGSVGLAIVAGLAPALRAATTDPMVSLRAE